VGVDSSSKESHFRPILKARAGKDKRRFNLRVSCRQPFPRIFSCKRLGLVHLLAGHTDMSHPRGGERLEKWVAIKLPRHVYSPRVGWGAPGQVARPGIHRLARVRQRNCPPGAPVWGPFSGTRLPRNSFEPERSPMPMLKGVLSSMNDGTRSDRALLREAFALLLGFRSQPHARKLLGQAVTFLRMLGHQGESGGLPIVVSVQVMRLRKY